MDKKFNVGDKVRVSDVYYKTEARGMIGVVVNDRGYLNNDWVEVDFGKHYSFTHFGTRNDCSRRTYRYLYCDDLTLVEKAKIEVGDRVRISDDYYIVGARGVEGVIVRENDSNIWTVKFDYSYPWTHSGSSKDKSNRVYRYIMKNYCTLVEKNVGVTESTTPTTPVTPTTKYKPGDEVTVKSNLNRYKHYIMNDSRISAQATDQMLTKRGKKVKIKSITKTGKYMIEGSIFPWVDEMFEEPVVEPKLISFVNFKKGGDLYSYLTEDTSITVGSEVIVPVGTVNKRVKAKVMRIGYYTDDELKYPIKDMKNVIEKVEEPPVKANPIITKCYEEEDGSVTINIQKIYTK